MFCVPVLTRQNVKLVGVVQRRLRNVQKIVIDVQNCYFANLNMSKPISFCRSRCGRRRRSLLARVVKKGWS